MNRLIARCGIIAAAVLAAACAEDALTPPGNPEFAISDAARDVNGIAGFYFRPPMLPEVAYPGVFDATLSPVVIVCQWMGAACGAEVARFTQTSGTDGELVSVTGDQYHANWHTRNFELDQSRTYRVIVEVGGFPLGHADIDVVGSGGQARSVNTGEYIPLVDGRTLPIKFRAERGIVGRMEIEPAEAVLEIGEELRLRIFIYDLHDDPLPGAASNWSLAFGGSGGSGSGGSASITADGVMTGLAPGSGSATAISGGRSVSIPFTVLTPAASVAFGSPTGSLAVGGTTSLAATAFDANGDAIPRPVAYSSSNPDVATIDAVTGLLTGVTPGATTITATTGGVSGTTLSLIYSGSGSGLLTLGPSGGTGDGGAVLMTPGGTLELVATFNVINLPISNITGYVLWASTSSSVAVISSAGVISAVGPGTTTISGCIGAVCGSLVLTVGGGPPVELAMLAGWTSAQANDVNNFGVVVGEVTVAGGRRAVRWDENGATELPVADGSTDCVAKGVNNPGAVVGTCFFGPSNRVYSRGVLWQNGQTTVLTSPVQFPGQPTIQMSTTAEDINDDGVIAGSAPRGWTLCCFQARAEIAVATWTAGAWTTFEWFGTRTQPDGVARAINASGATAGSVTVVINFVCGPSCFSAADILHAFRNAGTMTDLGVNFIPNQNLGISRGEGMNNQGDVVGSAHVFVSTNLVVNNAAWWPAGPPTAPVAVPVPTGGSANDINDDRWIVGGYATSGIHHAFLWRVGAEPEDLEPLVSGGSAFATAISQPRAGNVYVAGGANNGAGQARAVRWSVARP